MTAPEPTPGESMPDLLTELQDSVDRARAGRPAPRPPGPRRPRQPRTPGKIVVELTLPQIRVLIDAAAAHDTTLEDRADGLDHGDAAAAARDRAVLDRAWSALSVHLPRRTR